MPALITSTPRIKLAGSLLSDTLADRLVGLEVLLSTQQPGRATLRLTDDDHELLDAADFAAFKIGVRVTVALAEGEASTTEVFDGEIVAIGAEQASGRSVVTVEAQDAGHRFAASAPPSTYLGMTTTRIVTEVANRHGLTPKVASTAADATEHPYVAQADTDRALLDALARQIGCEWWTHGKELHFAERAAASNPVELTLGDNVVSVSVRYDGRDTPKSVQVTSWDDVNSQPIVGAAPGKPDTAALGSTASFVTDQHEAAQAKFGRALSIGELHTPSEKAAKTLAGAIERELQGNGLRVEATVFGEPTIRAGGWVKLQGLGTALSGDYHVTEVRHRFGPGQDLMTDVVGASRRAGSEPWSPGLVAPGAGAWTVRGPVPAIVTNVDDPDRLGRVKVKFPSLGDDIESAWARVVAPGAGKDRGFDLRPRVGDEVLVTFSHGDHALPYVLGGLWSKKQSHADPDKGERHHDALRSEDGALVTLHGKGDAGGKGHEHLGPWEDAGPDFEGAVSLRSKKKSGLLVADTVVLSSTKEDIIITNGKATISLLANGDITIEGESLSVDVKKDAGITAKGEATVEAKSVTLTGKSEVKVDAPKSTVKSMSGIKLQSGKVEVGP